MKRIYQFLAIIVAGLTLSAVSVSADTTECNIYDTGTDSYNSCVSNVNNNVTISCQNDVYVVNNSDQSSSTGPATVTDNSTSGSATSGSATNNNGTAQVIGSSCAPITTAAATTTPAATTTTPAAKTTTPAATVTKPAAKPVVASLPNTGSDSAIKTAGEVSLATVALLAFSQVGVNIYRRLALK